MYFRIALLPDERFSTSIKEASTIISKKYPSYFTLDKTHIPHLTLTAFESKTYDKMIEAKLAKYIQKIPVIHSVCTNIRADKKYTTYVGLYFQETAPFFFLRNEIKRLLKDDLSAMTTFKIPHITLTRLQKSKDRDNVTKEVNYLLDSSITFSRIAICDTQEYGSVSTIYKSFNLTLLK